MTYTAEDIQTAKDLLMESDIKYWTRQAYLLKDGSLELMEDDDDVIRPTIITPTQLLDWLATDGPSALIRQIGDPYQKAAIADLVAHNWDDLDYDVTTGDLVVQQLVLGEVRYG